MDSTGAGQTSQEITLGMQRVRAYFNPSENQKVKEIKEATAKLIDLVESLKKDVSSQTMVDGRLCSLAQTAYEEAAMWAVKAATS